MNLLFSDQLVPGQTLKVRLPKSEEKLPVQSPPTTSSSDSEEEEEEEEPSSLGESDELLSKGKRIKLSSSLDSSVKSRVSSSAAKKIEMDASATPRRADSETAQSLDKNIDL
jgi:hypothetical protein